MSIARAKSHLLNEQRARSRALDESGWQAKVDKLISSCYPAQRAFVTDPGRRIAALVGRGAGKSTGGRARLMIRMMTAKNARCIYVTKSRLMGEEIMWNQLKTLAERMQIDCKWNETKLKMTMLRTGSTLRIVGADDKFETEKLRGQPFHEVQVDEAASLGATVVSNLIYRIIGPRLGDYGGALVIYGTPGHVLAGPFYEVTRVGTKIGRLWSDRDKEEYRDWLGWSVHRWSLQDAAPHVPAIGRIWDEAIREKQANGWTDDNPVWRREYLGLWAADDTEMVFRYRPHLDDGTEWNQWDPPKDRKTGFAILPEGDHEWRYVYGIDLGHSDPFALVIFAYCLTSKQLYHVYEFGKEGMHAKAIAELLVGPDLDTDHPEGLIGVTGWPDGMDADTAGLGGMLLTELRDVYGISIEAAEKKNKHDAIELFNSDLVEGRIKILKGSVLEDQMQTLQWGIDTNGLLKEDKSARNDHCDAAVYGRRLAMHKFGVEGEESDEPKKKAERVKPEEDAPEEMVRPGPADDFSGWLDDGGYSDGW